MSPFLPLYFHCVRIYYLTLSGVAWGKFYSLLNKSYHGMAWHQMAHVCPRPGVLVPYVWKRNYKNSHWKFLLTFKFTHIHRELIKLKSWCENKVIKYLWILTSEFHIFYAACFPSQLHIRTIDGPKHGGRTWDYHVPCTLNIIEPCTWGCKKNFAIVFIRK